MAITKNSLSYGKTKNAQGKYSSKGSSVPPAGGTNLDDIRTRALEIQAQIPTASQAYKDAGIDLSGYDSTQDDLYAKLLKQSGQAALSTPNEKDIYKQKLDLYQNEINAANQIYAQKLSEAKTQGLSNLGTGRAIQARSGTLGSDFAVSQNDSINDQNQGVYDTINAERRSALAALMGKARSEAATELAAKREAQKSGLTDYLSYLGTQTERKAANAKKVALSLLDKDLDLKNIDPKQLASIAKTYGISTSSITDSYNEEKRTREAAAAEAEAQAIKDNSFEISEGQDRYGYDPKTGTYSLIASKGKTYAPSTGGGGGTLGGGGIYDQLDYRTANAVIAQGNQFTANPIVTKYNNLIGAANLIKAIDPNTQNPADHQAIVYNFAKALDPDSVVRENEYQTIKQYSQSTIDKYGGEIKQATTGKGFLSPKAIADIQRATEDRVAAYRPQYSNVRNATAQRINGIAGADVADQVLLDYEGGYTNGASSLEQSEADFLNGF